MAFFSPVRACVCVCVGGGGGDALQQFVLPSQQHIKPIFFSLCKNSPNLYSKLAFQRTSRLKSLRTCQPKYVKAQFDKNAHDKNIAWR